MDSFKVTDEGAGIIRVDADIRLVRKPIASAMCEEVDKRVADAGYGEFKILMNMSAMSKGTPSAGIYVLRSMKKYPLRALALYGANGFMRGMATTVLGLARFSNFALFDSEVIARDWLERGGTAPATLAPECTPATGRLRRLALPAGAAAGAALIVRAAYTRRAKDSSRPT
jgi:hypothetical protein